MTFCGNPILQAKTDSITYFSSGNRELSLVAGTFYNSAPTAKNFLFLPLHQELYLILFS